ncbi:hypothetical protein ACTMU2_21105 [Cupriavidus basilensis]
MPMVAAMRAHVRLLVEPEHLAHVVVRSAIKQLATAKGVAQRARAHLDIGGADGRERRG